MSICRVVECCKKPTITLAAVVRDGRRRGVRVDDLVVVVDL